jgi:hypothetical protein
MRHAVGGQSIGSMLLRAAWLSIVLGIAIELILVGLALSGGAVPGRSCFWLTARKRSHGRCWSASAWRSE